MQEKDERLVRELPWKRFELHASALGAGLREAYRLHERRRKRGRLTSWEIDKKMELISPAPVGESL